MAYYCVLTKKKGKKTQTNGVHALGNIKNVRAFFFRTRNGVSCWESEPTNGALRRRQPTHQAIGHFIASSFFTKKGVGAELLLKALRLVTFGWIENDLSGVCVCVCVCVCVRVFFLPHHECSSPRGGSRFKPWLHSRESLARRFSVRGCCYRIVLATFG